MRMAARLKAALAKVRMELGKELWQCIRMYILYIDSTKTWRIDDPARSKRNELCCTCRMSAALYLLADDARLSLELRNHCIHQ